MDEAGQSFQWDGEDFGQDADQSFIQGLQNDMQDDLHEEDFGLDAEQSFEQEFQNGPLQRIYPV